MQLCLFFYSQYLLWLPLCSNLASSQSLENPVFWQLPLVYNPSNSLDQGRMAVSQDFQVVNLGVDADSQHKRILIDMSNGCFQTINFSAIQQWNQHQLTNFVIQSRPKMALVERGGCSWNRKVTVVKYLSLIYRLNIEAMMIYDNDTHGTNITFDIQPITLGSSQKPMTYDTPLPFDRNITSMNDNDISQKGNYYNSTFYLPVYFTTKNHGLYLKNLDYFYSTSGNDSSSDLYQFYQIVPFLSTTPYQNISEKDGNGTEYSDVLSSGRGYIIYVLVIVAVFIIGAILLQYRKRRQISIQNERVVHPNPNPILQAHVNQVDPLPVSIVNTLPIIYYNMGNIKNTMCCICLDDYVENKSEIRVLPCGHGFCILCIDPWLTQKSTLCPICKYDCLPSDQRQQQQQHQQQGSNAPTSNGGDHGVDLSDVSTALNSVYYRNSQSTSEPVRLEHSQHHDGTTNSTQSQSALQNERSQQTSEQNDLDISDRN